MRSYYLLFACLFFLNSCNRASNSETMSRYHDDGRAKPVVAVVPVFDRSGADIPWNLSEEFTSTIERLLSRRSNIYLLDEAGVKKAASFLSETNNPFGKDLSWAPKTFDGNEFVVFLELVTHQLTPHEKGEESEEAPETTYTLDLTMRVRVVDIREEMPKVILQELVTQSHYIPKLLTHVDYTKNGWGKMSFNITPFGLSHAQFTRQISKRLEDYILLAKSQ